MKLKYWITAALLLVSLSSVAQVPSSTALLQQNIESYKNTKHAPSTPGYTFTLFLNNDTTGVDGTNIFIAKAWLDGDDPFHRGTTVSMLLPHAPEYTIFYPTYYTDITQFMLSVNLLVGYKVGQADWFEPVNTSFPNASCATPAFDQTITYGQVSVYASANGGFTCTITLSQ
jgi:hypothetical protein